MAGCHSLDNYWETLLTFSYCEQVAKISSGWVGGRRLKALNLTQHEVIVIGQVWQAEEVVALLGVQGGAGHAAVQHLRNRRTNWENLVIISTSKPRLATDSTAWQWEVLWRLICDSDVSRHRHVRYDGAWRDDVQWHSCGPVSDWHDPGAEAKGACMVHLHHKAMVAGRERKREKRVFIATNPFLLWCVSVSIYITDGRASVGRAR